VLNGRLTVETLDFWDFEFWKKRAIAVAKFAAPIFAKAMSDLDSNCVGSASGFAARVANQQQYHYAELLF
jgi:hypothetical protein